MNTIVEQPAPEYVSPFVSNRARFLHWRTKLETFKVVQGFGTLLDHVTEHQWRARYAANEDAFTAVVEELKRIDD